MFVFDYAHRYVSTTVLSNDSHEESYWPIRSTTSTKRMKNRTYCDCYWGGKSNAFRVALEWKLTSSLCFPLSRYGLAESEEEEEENGKDEEKEGVTRTRLSLSKRASGRIREYRDEYSGRKRRIEEVPSRKTKTMRTSTAKGITSKTTTKVGDEKDKGRSGVAVGDEPNFVLSVEQLIERVQRDERASILR
ncbi:uncharacterized protein LOC118446782 [Vespa mandarinia]|uniref:uncharacterized protein LOC118446782 n=1 Tax=Vespa mandarinia TaxID=7446 RepID=UPI00161BF314|nr:uncharacterized protein LOC118446782 [Vespa mandarinia]